MIYITIITYIYNIFIGSIAETNRPPFDLAEAESELVSGFMTEHAAVVFVFFFLAEYSSIVLMCILTSLLFLGGYLLLFDISYLFHIIDYAGSSLFFESWYLDSNRFYLYDLLFNNNPFWEGFVHGLTLGIKSCILIFCFVWIRASFPRIRFDQLMSFCWTVLLPIIFAFIILVPCILYSFDLLPANSNISLFGVLPLVLKVKRDSINFPRPRDTALPIQEEDGYGSIPVHKVYSLLEDKSTLLNIKKDFKLFSGRCAFVNNEINKVYIVSSFNLAKRLNPHFNMLVSSVWPLENLPYVFIGLVLLVILFFSISCLLN